MAVNAINDFLASKNNKKNVSTDLEIDQEALRKAVIEKSGMPVLISHPRSQNQLQAQEQDSNLF
jgi:L,D-transpeptidase ErfK/SrfK